MRPIIGSFNSMKSPDRESDGIPSEISNPPPRCQGRGSFNHKEGENQNLIEIFCEPGTGISLQNNNGFHNYLNRQARGIGASGIRYPPYLATIGLNATNKSSCISNETPRKIRKIRRVKSSWTKSKDDESRSRDNSDSLNHATSPDHKPDAASSNSRASSPATFGCKFMDYLIANYSHGIFNPHRDSLTSLLSPDPEQSFDPTFVSSNQPALSFSSYNPKATKPITAEENNNPHHCNDQRDMYRPQTRP